MAHRPLSPHLQIYRFAYTMALSILHRASGITLSCGIVLLVAFVMATASGSDSYLAFAAFAGHPVGRILIALCVAAFCYHLANGVRHLFWDLGIGLERAQARRSAVVVVALAALAAALLVYLFFVRSGVAA
jgi:succinate dehydrogenase / fumarate reductase, cytochrome b subunit